MPQVWVKWGVLRDFDFKCWVKTFRKVAAACSYTRLIRVTVMESSELRQSADRTLKSGFLVV